METKLLTTEDVSDLLSVSQITLRKWRANSEGPKFMKLTRGLRGAIRYRLADVLEYLKRQEVNS